MGKQLTDDYLKWVLDIDGKPAQKSLNDLSIKTVELRNSNKSLNAEMEKLRAKGKENTAEFKKLDTQFKENNNTIKQTETKMAALRKEIGLNGLSQKELRKYLNETKRAWELATPGTDEYKKLDKELKAITARQAELRGSTDKTNGTFGALKTSTLAVWGAIAGTVTAFGGLISSVINTYGEFEKYRSVLTNAYGSSEIAAEKMAMLQDVAADLPISLREATESFIKMKNSGMEPTRDMMITLTDVAASQGKSLDQYVEALKDAKMFEWERLKEFGVKAQVAGDNVTFTFRGQQTVVKKSSEAVEQYLIGLGKLQGIAGSSAAVMNTLEGKISNLGDSWDRMLVAMGDGGFGKAAKEIISLSGKIVDSFTSWISKSPAEMLEQTRIKLQMEQIDLNNSNMKHEDRVTLINKLKQEYPAYLGNIDAETVSNEELNKVLNKVNEDLINKIVLQKADTEIADKQNDIAENKIRLGEASIALNEMLAEKEKEYNIKLNKSLGDTYKIAEDFQAKLKKSRGFDSTSLLGSDADLSGAMQNFSIASDIYNGSMKEGNGLVKHRNELIKTLGLDMMTQNDEMKEAAAKAEEEEKKKEAAEAAARNAKALKDEEERKKREEKSIKEEEERLKKISESRVKFYQDLDAFEEANKNAKLSKDQQELAAIDKKYNTEKQKAREARDAGIITEQQYLDRIAQLDEMNAQDIVAKRQEFADRDFEKQTADQEASEKRKQEIKEKYTVEGTDVLKARELAVIEGLHNQGLMDEETYQQAKKDIIDKYNQLQKESDKAAREEMVQGYIDTLTDIESKAAILSDTVSNFKQAETIKVDTEHKKQQKSLDDKYKKDIKSAGNDANKKKQIDEQYNRDKEIMANDYEAKKAAIQKKWAGKELLLKIAEIVANTGVGIMKTYAEFGYPLGIPMTVLLAVQGASQLALAKAQYDQAMSGFATGGHTGNGAVNEVAGVVHKGEYVIPAWQMQTPYTMQIVPVLEAIRQNRNGYALGGYTSTSTNQTSSIALNSDPEMKSNIALNNMLLQQLLNEGVKSKMVYGPKDIEDWNKNNDDINFIKNKAAGR
jgi:hypothetical protein